jgi:transposase InsO family protein
MQRDGIRAKSQRCFRVTTDSNHNLPIAPNLINREFAVVELDKLLAGDITYVATDEGWLFPAVLIDRYSCQVVGWTLCEDISRKTFIDALRVAVQAPSFQNVMADLSTQSRQLAGVSGTTVSGFR